MFEFFLQLVQNKIKPKVLSLMYRIHKKQIKKKNPQKESCQENLNRIKMRPFGPLP